MSLRLAALAAAALLAACTQEPEPLRREFFAFGTLVEITVRHRPRAQALAAIDTVRVELERLHQAWQPQGEGELGAINRALARGEAAPVSGELATLLARARRIEQASGGRFNAGIGRLVRLWGFDSEAPRGPPPEPAQLAAWRAAVPGLSGLRLAGGTARSDHSALRLDLGGIAKGYAAERAAVLLSGAGVRHALIAVGGDLHAFGRNGRRPWHVGIRGPRGGLLGTLDLHHGEALSTSGDYERFFEWGGRRYHHLLDPASGAPARGLAAASVLTRDGVLADAAATALFVAGPAQWREVAGALGVETALVVRADGRVETTPAAAGRLRSRSDALDLNDGSDAPG